MEGGGYPVLAQSSSIAEFQGRLPRRLSWAYHRPVLSSIRKTWEDDFLSLVRVRLRSRFGGLARLGYGSTALDNPHEDHDHRNDEEEMDETSERGGGDHP